MAEGVVDLLEPVEVEQQDRELRAVALGERPRALRVVPLNSDRLARPVRSSCSAAHSFFIWPAADRWMAATGITARIVISGETTIIAATIGPIASCEPLTEISNSRVERNSFQNPVAVIWPMTKLTTTSLTRK